jgi:hypothetical protein
MVVTPPPHRSAPEELNEKLRLEVVAETNVAVAGNGSHVTVVVVVVPVVASV